MLSLRALLLAAVALLALFAASPTRAGLPTGTVSDLQTCQSYAQELQAGRLPANARNADTLATVRVRLVLSLGALGPRRVVLRGEKASIFPERDARRHVAGADA